MWRYLESTSKQHLSHNGLRNLMQDIKVVFESWSLNQFEVYDKEIKLILNSYLNDRIDREKLPWSKRNANRPPYKIWLLLSETMAKSLRNNDFTSEDKKMRLHQALLALVWTRSCGARLAEVMRLKLSDVKALKLENGHWYLNLNIRRSKSNRKGKKMLNYKCLKNDLEPGLCPIRTFQSYLKNNTRICQPGDWIFPSSHKHFGKKISGKAMTDSWKKTATMLNLPKHYYPMAHSGHDCLLVLAVAQKQPQEEILDATKWSNIKTLSHYVEGPTANNINYTLATTPVDELDNLTRDLRDFNLKKIITPKFIDRNIYDEKVYII